MKAYQRPRIKSTGMIEPRLGIRRERRAGKRGPGPKAGAVVAPGRAGRWPWQLWGRRRVATLPVRQGRTRQGQAGGCLAWLDAARAAPKPARPRHLPFNAPQAVSAMLTLPRAFKRSLEPLNAAGRGLGPLSRAARPAKNGPGACPKVPQRFEAVSFHPNFPQSPKAPQSFFWR
jgi:hypothetical protein